MAKGDEKITLTRDELEAWYESKKKDETMEPAEKKARATIAEVVDERLRAFFSFDDEDESGGKKKKAKSTVGGFFEGLLGGPDDEDDEDDDE
jgi:hypothetical protein